MAGQQVDTRAPLGVVPDDGIPGPGFCTVQCVLPDFKTSSLPGNKKPAKGHSFTHVFKEMGLSFQAQALNQKKQAIRYEYVIKQLPGLIDPILSKCKLKDGKVVFVLKKVSETAWNLTNGLDQYEEEEEEEESTPDL